MKKLLVLILLLATCYSNWFEIVTNECNLYPSDKVNPELIHAIIWQESKDGKYIYNSNSINICYGLMQVSDVLVDWINYLEPTVKLKHKDLYDNYINIHWGVWYYGYCLWKGNWNESNALFLYNNGHNATNTNYIYANKVLKKYLELIK